MITLLKREGGTAFFFFFFFFYVPQLYLGFTTLSEIFVYMTVLIIQPLR